MSKQNLLKGRIRASLTCLYTISNLDEYELSINELLQEAVKCLPNAVQNSNCSAACIEYNGEKFCTNNFKPARWTLSEKHTNSRGQILTVHISYFGKQTKADPFLGEEREIIQSIADQLALKIERIIKRREKEKKQRLLNKSYSISNIETWEIDNQNSRIYCPFIKELSGTEDWGDQDLDAIYLLAKEGESRQRIKKKIASSIETGESFDIEIEWKTGTDLTVWTRMIGEAEFEDGTCTRLYGTLQNIQKRKQTELELVQSREKLQKIMNQSPDVICTTDVEGRFVEVSEKSMPAWGYKPHEMEGELMLKFIQKEDVDKTRKAYRQIAAGKEMNNFENRYLHKDGSVVPIIWSIKWDEHDELMYCVARDGREKKRAEQKLKERKEFIETAIENLPIGLSVYQIDTGKTQLVNRKFGEICGWPKKAFTDLESSFEILFPEKNYRKQIKEQFFKDIKSGDRSRMTWEGIKITTKSGDERILSAKNIPIYDQNLMISTVVDITEQKEAEQKLIENEKRFKALVQEGSELLAIVDEEGIYKYVSPTAENILGIKAESFIGKDLLEFIHDRDKHKIIRVIKNLPEMKRFKVPPIRFRDVNYNWRWLETTITNMVNEPAVGGYVANSRDITERVAQQEKLAESLEEKQFLLSEIHHRVKNNLAIVSGILQLQVYDEDVDEVVERLYDSIFRIQTMASIHELLYQTENFSRLKFSEIIEKLILGISKTLKGPVDVDVQITQDEHELNINQAIPCSLIINEVVTNIYKHAFEGKKKGLMQVTIRENNGWMFLKIRDNGNGLPKGVNTKESSTLGMNIIRILSIQLEAEYQFKSSSKGTIFELEFEVNRAKELMDSN